MRRVTTILVVVFDNSGEPAETHWISSPAEAREKVKDLRRNGCDWVKLYAITSPPVPLARAN